MRYELTGGNILAVAAIAVLALLLSNGYTYYRAEQAKDWEVARGTITKSKVEVTGVRRDSRTNKSRRQYESVIRYDYHVDGKRHSGDRVSFSIWNSVSTVRLGFSHAATSRSTEKYPEGTIVDVFYDPDDPSASVLERDCPMFVFWSTAIVMGVVAGGGMGFVARVIRRA